MKLNVRFYEQNETFRGFQESNEQIGVNFGESTIIVEKDYNDLINHPIINGVELIGSLTAEDLGLSNVYYDTTAHWDQQASLIGERGVVYIYSDHEWIEDEVGNRIPVAGIRIGDGNAYLKDTPFITDAMTWAIINHVSNSSVHVTPQEKVFWNNKVSGFLDRQESETLILSKTHYEDNGEIVSG